MAARGSFGLLALALTLAADVRAADADAQEFPVTTEPPGALVTSIVGELGTTPLRISERTIYPNEFPPEQLDLYGKLIISRAGCTTVTHQVTLAEVGAGVSVALDCWKQDHGVRTEVLGGSAEPAAVATPQRATESIAERRLRQLRVLDELLQEGLLTADEERRLRQRILVE